MTEIFSTPDDFGEIRASQLHAGLSERLGAQVADTLDPKNSLSGMWFVRRAREAAAGGELDAPGRIERPERRAPGGVSRGVQAGDVGSSGIVLRSVERSEERKMLRKLKRSFLLSWPVRVVHMLSQRLHQAYFAEFDPFGEAVAWVPPDEKQTAYQAGSGVLRSVQ